MYLSLAGRSQPSVPPNTVYLHPADGVDAMAKLVEYGHQNYPHISTKILVNAISFVIVGEAGAGTILRAGFPSTKYNDKRHPLTEIDTGFHQHFSQTGGVQIFHFWAYLNTESQSPIAAFLADSIHECNNDLGLTGGHGTVEDARLTTVAYRMGTEVRGGGIHPLTLAARIRFDLKSPFTGCLAPWYSRIDCKWLRDMDNNQRKTIC